jgi:hypothetical protein
LADPATHSANLGCAERALQDLRVNCSAQVVGDSLTELYQSIPAGLQDLGKSNEHLMP